MSVFHSSEWKSFYGDAKEVILDNAPKAHESKGELWMFTDSDHVNNKTWGQSRAGLYILINMACIVWFM